MALMMTEAPGRHIRADVADLRQYLLELRELLFDQAATTAPGGGKVSGSPAPWNTPIGELIMDVHAGARQLADQLDRLTGNRTGPRGSTDAGTLVALSRVAQRVEAIRAYGRPTEYEVDSAASAARQVARWALRSRHELGQLREGEEAWSRVPGGLRCPNSFNADHPQSGLCNAELWLAPGWAVDPKPPIYCLATCCRDTDGEPCAWLYSEWSPLVA